MPDRPPPPSAGDFDVVRRAYVPGLPTRPFLHENPGFELTWVEAGAIAFAVGKTALPAGAGACVLLPPAIENTPADWRGTAHQISLSRALVEEAADALAGRARLPDAGRVVAPGERLARLCELVAREVEAGVPHADPGLGALVQALAFGLVRGEGAPAVHRRPDRRIRRALARIEADFAADLSVDALAAEAGMSRFPFLRTFRAQVGVSPYQHLLSVRLGQAARLLAGTDRSILEIAYATGFGDPGRFARQFRARYGQLPRAYRAAAR